MELWNENVKYFFNMINNMPEKRWLVCLLLRRINSWSQQTYFYLRVNPKQIKLKNQQVIRFQSKTNQTFRRFCKCGHVQLKLKFDIFPDDVGKKLDKRLKFSKITRFDLSRYFWRTCKIANWRNHRNSWKNSQRQTQEWMTTFQKNQRGKKSSSKELWNKKLTHKRTRKRSHNAYAHYRIGKYFFVSGCMSHQIKAVYDLANWKIPGKS